ncbi:hypothetical protein Dehly_0165 [Dehalogenimonas lykanthroporepellens BL-DC-9]|nr:hypothetical protein Dehly_0165 [Dehalogenimonas lykanthroporepellens BL-DC-9]
MIRVNTETASRLPVARSDVKRRYCEGASAPVAISVPPKLKADC